VRQDTIRYNSLTWAKNVDTLSAYFTAHDQKYEEKLNEDDDRIIIWNIKQS